VSSVTFPPALGGDGSTVTDDPDPNTGLGNGGHRLRFVPSLYQSVAVMSGAVSQAQAAQQAAATAASCPMWTNIAYSIGDVRWSPVTYLVYRRIVAGTTNTDPSADPTNWRLAVALPDQAGHAGQEIVTNGQVAAWGLSAPGAMAVLNFIGY